MGTFDLVIDRLSYIVKKACPFCLLFRKPQFSRHNPADERNLNRMDIDILRIACSEFKPAYKLYQFGMKTMNPDIKDSLLASLFNRLFNLLLNLAYNLFNPCGMYPSVSHKPLQCYLCHLSPYRVVAGEYHSLRRIVYNNINARSGFYCPYITALSADNPSLDRKSTRLNSSHSSIS